MLSALFAPSSVAVLGASADPRKVGHAVLRNLISFGYSGRIYPINPNASEVLGLRAYARVSEIGSALDLAVIAIPARFVPDALRDCVKASVKVAVIISAGFKETGAEGIRLEEEIRHIAKETGIRVLGPNCLGVINSSNGLNATFAAGMLPNGRTAFFSQSGALGIAILDWAIGQRIGFSKFISLGNKADLYEIDFIEYFMDDPETDVILGYIEDVVDGKRFLEVAKTVTKKKPVVLIKSGGTEAGAKAASSHTGALAGSDSAFDAAFKQTGVIRAKDISELFDCSLTFSGRRLPSGKKLLIVTNAGGPGIMAADEAERLGIELPILKKETIEFLKSVLPLNASLYNPIDLIGDATSERYRAVLEKAVAEPNIDGILVILTPQAMTDVEGVSDAVIDAFGKTDKPIIPAFMGEARIKTAVEKLKAAGIYNFPYPEKAVRAFKRLCDYRAWQLLPADEHCIIEHKKHSAETILRRTQSGWLPEADAFGVLSAYGFRFPKMALARTSDEAQAVASKIGFPVVMKISSPDIVHKTDVGGVRLGIATKVQAKDAFIEITANVRRLMPRAFINGVMVYETAPAGRELILGVSYDRTFGHMLMFGMGGIYVEVMKDVSFRVAPVGRRDAQEMITEVKASALLKGVRGQSPVDIERIVDAICALSDLVMDFPSIKEIDINPLVVGQSDAMALDARVFVEGTTRIEGGSK